MSVVEKAIAEGRCALAVNGALLRDERVVLHLKERAALRPMALAGTPPPPVVPLSDRALARAIGQKNGVLVLVEPGPQDKAGIQRIAQLVSTAPHKPTLVVVARKYDAFGLQMAFRGLKIQHVKDKGLPWLGSLPLPPADLEDAPDVPKASDRKKASEPDSPRFCLAGRDDEIATLKGHLEQGGPVVLTGPRGIGRTHLAEHVISVGEFTRLPDMHLVRGVGFDTLIARLAVIGKAAGVTTLADALAAEHTPQQLVDAAVATLQAAESTKGQVFLVHGLQAAAGRSGDFFRTSRLELLMKALLTTTYPLSIVFVSAVSPVFFKEGVTVPEITLGPILGRFFHDIFQAYHAPEIPREHFGPLSERLHGHPLAAKLFAVALRQDPGLIEDDKFFKLKGIDDDEGIGKQLEKRVGRLSKDLRPILARLAHVHMPMDGQFLADMGVKRRTRIALLSEGVLEMLGSEEGQKTYRVHPMVRRALSLREVSDFDVMPRVADLLLEKAGQTEDEVTALAYRQEANRLLDGARMHRNVVDLGLPDGDPAIHAIAGMMRGQKPRHDLAAQRIAELLDQDPSNSDAHLMKLELLRHTGAKHEAFKEAAEAAVAKAPVPEVFHEVVGTYLSRNARGQAIRVLETAIEVLPGESRLRCRLAALLIRQGRRPDAIAHLETAMAQDPKLPDPYGLLGTLKREEGAEAIEEAESMLRMAVDLAPGDVVQTSRLIWLLLDIHKGVPERREAVAEEVTALLDSMVEADRQSWEAHLTYAVALREMGGDLERARWFLGKARKFAPGKRRRSLADRFDLEAALLDCAEGKLDKAEASLKKLERKDPSNHRVFAGLAKVLEARAQLVAAHAHLSRAADRTSPFSLDRQAYDLDLKRLQHAIEQQAAAMVPGTVPPPAAEATEPAHEPAPVEPAAEQPTEPDEPEPATDEDGDTPDVAAVQAEPTPEPEATPAPEPASEPEAAPDADAPAPETTADNPQPRSSDPTSADTADTADQADTTEPDDESETKTGA